MFRVIALLMLLCASVAHAQDLRWRGYPAPRSGVAVLEVDHTGKVTGARMLKSTGDSARCHCGTPIQAVAFEAGHSLARQDSDHVRANRCEALMRVTRQHLTNR